MRTPINWFERVVGIFSLLVLLILGAVLIVTARKHNVFDFRRPVILHTWVPEGYGIKAASSLVLLSEVEVGIVTSVELTEGGPPNPTDTGKAALPVRISMQVEGRNAKWLKAGTYCEVDRPPIGSATLKLFAPATATQSLVDELTRELTIAWQPTESLIEKLLKVKDDVFAIREEVIKTLHDLQKIIENVRITTDAIAQGQGSIGGIVQRTELLDEITGAVRDARAIVEDLKLISERVATDTVPAMTDRTKLILDDLRGTVQHVDGLVADVNGVVREVNQTVVKVRGQLDPIPELLASLLRTLKDVEVLTRNTRDASSGFPELARKVDASLLHVNLILMSLKENFLIKGNLPAAAPVRSEAEALPRAGRAGP